MSTPKQPESKSVTVAQPSAGPADPAPAASNEEPSTVREIGGPSGPEPIRYGDWERKGRCIDF